MWSLGLLALSLAPEAHALDAADWKDTRWVLESEIVSPRSVTLLAIDNVGIRTKATQLRIVAHCTDVTQPNKKALLVTCDIEDAAMKATPPSVKPPPRELDNGQKTLDDVVARYKEATIEFQINHKGKVTRTDVLGLSQDNIRERESAEVMRQLVTDLVAGFNLSQPPTGWESAWGEKNSNLMRVPGVRQAGTSNDLQHQGQVHDGKLIVQSVGKGMVNIPYDAWELEAGENLPLAEGQDRQIEGGGEADPDGGTVGGTVYGGGFQQQGAQAVGSTPEIVTYKVQMSGIGIVKDDRMVERIWTVAGESAVGNIGSTQGVNLFYNGHMRKLGADEKVDLGATGMVAPPNMPVEGLPNWAPLNN